MQNNFYDIAFEIDELIKEYSDTNLEKIESYFKYDGIKDYFLRKLSELPNLQPWFKSLYLKNYFNPKNNPKPYLMSDRTSYRIPYWNILPILKKVADENKENLNENMDILVEIVNSIINYKDENNKRIENGNTDYVLFTVISNFPKEKIEKQHIEFLRTILKSYNGNKTLISNEIKENLLPNFIQKESKYLLKGLLEIILDYSQESQGEKYKSILDEFWLNETLKSRKKEIFEFYGVEVAGIALEKIKKIIKNYQTCVNYIQLPAIEDHPQTSFPERYEYQLVYFVRDMFELSDPKQIIDKIQNLINEEYPIFKRIAIHTINYHYGDLKDIFWDLNENPLKMSNLRHEIYILLKTRFSLFTNNQVQRLINWIEEIEYMPREEEYNEENLDEINAYRRLRWLDAVKKSENEKIKQLYQYYKKKHPDELEHPDFNFWFSGLIPVKAVCPEELQKKSNEQIAKYLIDHEDDDEDIKLVKEKFSLKECIEKFSLKECVKNDPDKFSHNLEPFLGVSRKNQYDLLYGFIEALNDGKDFEWDEILEFISSIINPEKFWNEKFSGDNYRDWIISEIADMITKKTQNDDNPLKKELLPKICKILLKLANNTNSELYSERDVITSVINSPKGKIFAAMINFSLHYSRLYKKDEEQKWIDPIKKDFSDRLKDPSVEFSVTLGRYLPNLLYLDKKWVIDNINEIFADSNWKEAFIGYLLFSNVYTELYETLKKEGHYERAIDTDFEDEIVNEKLVDHVCIAYLYDMDDINNNESLIYKLILNKNINQFNGIISFFLYQKEQNIDINAKIRPIWRYLFEIISKDPKYYKEIASNLSKWLLFFDKIDNELLNWITLSSKYVGTNYNQMELIEHLFNHVEKTPNKVGKIYVEMINNDIYPEYNSEEIKKTVKKTVQILYEKNEKEYADIISNKYGEKGNYFLKEIYRKYNINET